MKRSTFSSRQTKSTPTYNRRRTPYYTSKKTPWYKRIFAGGVLSVRRIIGGILILGVIGFLIIWRLFLHDLPDIRTIKDGGHFEEHTVLYDKNGNEFYSFASTGKRTYVTYEEISPSIIDALISTEDQRFFENPGIDIFGLMRAGINYITGRDSQIRATSTLSQQLVKNTLLTNERSLKRKVQEAYLAYQLNKEYSKEEILEMYLNVIEFGHNANGVEQASRTFFGKSAKDVGPLGASILASLPKSPTRYSPYLHRDLLMGKIEAYPADTPSDRVMLSIETANAAYAPVYHVFREYIKNLSFEAQGNMVLACNLNPSYNALPSIRINSQGCATVAYGDLIHLLGAIQVTGNLAIDGHPSEPYTIEYTVGRKDIVASLTFENQKIDGKTFGKIIFDGLEFQFEKPSGSIQYPYFVMYIKEYLENRYGKDMNIQKGLRVYTTLDPELQAYAEQVIREQVESNSKKHGATSAALVSMDNKTGKLLAMVGGPDYFDVENGGNNNMVTALRQPGSSFKTIVYALAISKNPIGILSPVADVDTKFGTYAPNNYDGKFNGIMTLGSALAYSRNIPAVKMYFLAGREEAIIQFADTLGIRTLGRGDFGASLALGAGEVRPIDMMQAFSVFANNGIKRDLFAIERIEDNAGRIIEQYAGNEGREVFSPAASYIVSKMLSDNNLRPASPFWREQLTIPGKTVAAKTGTSNKPAKKGSSQIFPGDTWTVGYSPTVTTVVWAGNVDGSPLKGWCDGINCAAPAWNKFMRKALADTPNIDFTPPEGLLKVNIVKSSGLLPNDKTPQGDIVSDIMAVALKTVDEGYKEIQVDSLCGGPVTANTPEESIMVSHVPTAKPIIDGYDPEWTRGFFGAIGSYVLGSVLETTSTTPCDRPSGEGQVTITSRLTGVTQNILEVSWSGNRAIRTFRVTVDGKVVKERTYEGDGLSSGSDRINIQEIQNAQNIRVDIVDVYGYRYSRTGASGGSDDNEVILPTLPSIIEEDQNNPNAPAPSITISNPARNNISIYAGDVFNLRFQASIHTARRTISVTIDGDTIQTAQSGEIFVIPVSTLNLAPGAHTVTVTATDANNNSDSKSFTLTILER